MRDGMSLGSSRRQRRNAGAALRRSQNHNVRRLAPRRVSWFPANAERSEPAPARSTQLESCPPATVRALVPTYGAYGNTGRDRKSTRLNSSHLVISYAVFCLKKKKRDKRQSSGVYEN